MEKLLNRDILPTMTDHDVLIELRVLMQEMIRRIDGVENRFTSVEARFARVETRVDQLEGFRFKLLGGAAVVGALMGLLAGWAKKFFN